MKTIGLFFETNSEYGREFLKGVALYAHERKKLRLKLLPYDDEIGDDQLASCDGIILRTGERKTFEKLKATGLPLVDAFRQFPDPEIPSVDSDHRMTAEIATDFFVRHGFRNFAFCGYGGTRYAEEREHLFREALSRHGYDCATFNDFNPPKKDVFIKTQSRHPVKAHLGNWLRMLPRRTAILCANDLMAYHVIQASLSIGRDIPDDFAVLGIDNDTLLCLCAPVKLSSIDPRASQVGYAAARILHERLQGAAIKSDIHLVPPGELFERDSTAVYPLEPAWFEAALTHIDNHLDSCILPKDVAKTVGVSQTALQATFRRHFGISAGKYILDIRMRRAKTLLESHGLWVKEVARSTGFSSSAHFCHAFRTYYGVTPSTSRLKNDKHGNILV